jgi:hypothetical protein
MSILKEIREQPEWARLALFGLSCVTVLSVAGYAWFTSFERNAYIALNPEDGAERYAQIAKSRPDPVSTVRKGVDRAAANIGSFIGFDSSKGFDIGPRNEDNQDRVYLLPLSE